MGIFGESSQFYKKKVITQKKSPLFKWLLLTIFTIYILFFGLVLWSKIILTLILIFWSYVLVWSMNSYLKEIKKKYYPNGQLKYNISVISFNGPKPSEIVTKETWYENGQLKSECKETPYGSSPKKYLKTWYKNGQLKSEYKDKNGVILIDKCWDENGKEKTSEPID